MILTNSANAIQGSFYSLWFTVAMYVPRILAAIIIFLIGWIVATVLYRLIVEVVKTLKVDEALKKAGVHEAAKEAGLVLDTGRLLGTLVMWFMLLVFLVASLDILGLTTATIFLERVVLLYIPQVIVAALIIIIGALVADIVKGFVIGSAKAISTRAAHVAGMIAKWAVWVFAIIAALDQLGVASLFIQTLFTGIVVALSLAFGLAFGLGGKEAAAHAIERIKQDIKHDL